MPVKGLDVATSAVESDWFFAASHHDMLDRFCVEWSGTRTWACLDVFSASGKFAATFRKGGHRATSYDIKSDVSQDLTTQSGFLQLLRLGMESLA